MLNSSTLCLFQSPEAREMALLLDLACHHQKCAHFLCVCVCIFVCMYIYLWVVWEGNDRMSLKFTCKRVCHFMVFSSSCSFFFSFYILAFYRKCSLSWSIGLILNVHRRIEEIKLACSFSYTITKNIFFSVAVSRFFSLNNKVTISLKRQILIFYLFYDPHNYVNPC